jgi:hypothetical protein
LGACQRETGRVDEVVSIARSRTLVETVFVLFIGMEEVVESGWKLDLYGDLIYD